MKTMLFNPYTGTPRHPSDIASDPEGLLIVDDGTPLHPHKPAIAPTLSVGEIVELRIRAKGEHVAFARAVERACASKWGVRVEGEA